MKCPRCGHDQPLQRRQDGIPFTVQLCRQCGGLTEQNPAVGNAPEELAPTGYFVRMLEQMRRER